MSGENGMKLRELRLSGQEENLNGKSMVMEKIWKHMSDLLLNLRSNLFL